MELVPYEKKIVDCTVLDQVRNFEYLIYNPSYIKNKDVVNKLHKFDHKMCEIIKETLKSRSEGISLKFYKPSSHFSMAVSYTHLVCDIANV